MISYTLTRTKRKTIAIYITYNGVEVRAPHVTPKYEIDRFVASKEKWIEEKASIMRERMENRDSFRLDYGSLVLFRGMTYPIAESKDAIGFDGACFRVPPGLDFEEIKRACIDIYRMQAKRVIEPRTSAFAEQMAVNYASVKITGAQKQWGSCTAKKRINFSWRLMMADDALIDYVIVHELAHTLELNHSADFWDIVGAFLPDFRERKKRLDELHERIANEDWKINKIIGDSAKNKSSA